MTRGTSLQAVHDAIYDTMVADTTGLMVHITGVYDWLPENATEPYVIIRSPTEAPWDMFGTMAQRDTFTVDIWSKYRGSKEVKEIVAHLNDILDRTTLSVSGYTSIWIYNTFTTDMRDPDMIHWHGIMKFTVYVNQ